jgi:hypothetical protein
LADRHYKELDARRFIGSVRFPLTAFRLDQPDLVVLIEHTSLECVGILGLHDVAIAAFAALDPLEMTRPRVLRISR